MTTLMILVVMILCFASGFGFLVAMFETNYEFITPRHFYEDGYNWFGAYLIFILKTIISFPWFVIIKICTSLWKFIKWLLTVGR